MFEKFQNPIEQKSEPKKEKISLIDKTLRVIKDGAKITTLLSLFAVSLNEVNASESNEKDPVDLKHKIELAKESISIINVALEKVCKGQTHTLGRQDIRSFKPIDGTEIVSANDGSWFMLMDKDGRNTFADYNQDGTVDRFIINNEDEEHEKGILLNSTYAFGDMEFHAQFGKITSGSEMEKDIKIVSFDLKNNKMECVDTKSGESGIIAGEEVVEFYKQVQIAYISKLENIINGTNEIDSSLIDLKEYEVKKPINPPEGNKPEKQPVYNPSKSEKSDYHATFEDFKKAKESEFDNFKKAQEEEFNKFKEGK